MGRRHGPDIHRGKLMTGEGWLKIELEPHPAREYVHGVPVIIIKDQQQIMVNGARAGYCGTEPGKPISFIRRYHDDFKKMVVDFVTEKLGSVGSVNEPPPPPEPERKRKRR